MSLDRGSVGGVVSLQRRNIANITTPLGGYSKGPDIEISLRIRRGLMLCDVLCSVQRALLDCNHPVNGGMDRRQCLWDESKRRWLQPGDDDSPPRCVESLGRCDPLLHASDSATAG
jgi:hypothetical protein